MTEFEFATIEEVGDTLQNSPDFCKVSYREIKRSFEENKEVANICVIKILLSFSEYKIALHKKSWHKALSACLKVFEESEEYDYAIDTYILMKQIKQENGKNGQ